MKNNFKTLTATVFLTGILCIFLISSCKKVELGVPLAKPTQSRGKLPPPAVAYNATLTVTPTGTHTVTTTISSTVTPTVTITSTVTSTTNTTTTTTTNTGVYDPGCECYVPATGTNTPPAITCSPVFSPIFAGAGGNDTTKGTKVGNVRYSNDGVNLYVTSIFSGPTCPTELALWAGSNLATMPTSKGGVPFGQFPYQFSPASCGSHTFTIPLSSLFPAGTTNFCNKNIYIVLHAAMGADASVEGSTEQTAIAYGSQTFAGPRWGWIATYPVCCQ